VYQARDAQLFEHAIALQQMPHREAAHSGGRSEVNFPVNSFEAESRGMARFRLLGDAPGPMDPAPG